MRRLGDSLKVIHLALLIVSAGFASWAAFSFFDSASAQRSGNHVLEQSKPSPPVAASHPAPSGQDTSLRPVAEARPAQPRKARGELLGRFEIPRLGLSYDLLEGTDDRTLDRSIGHVENTGQIGESGNIGIAGHRNTHFRKVEWLRRGDEIVLSSPAGVFRYEVEWIRLVAPTAVEVLDPKYGPAVTLVTCFPFEYVGSAPLRHIVRAIPAGDPRAKLVPAAVSGSNP